MGVGLIRWVDKQDPSLRPLVEVSTRDLVQAAFFTLLSVPLIWIIIRLYWAASGGS
jgi:hypothetical protein